MEYNNYKIIFEKLGEELQGNSITIDHTGNVISTAELDEIAELRRIALEVTLPDNFYNSYTTT